MTAFFYNIYISQYVNIPLPSTNSKRIIKWTNTDIHK
jgi:hypothetical protein